MSPTFLLGDNLLPNEAKYGFQQCQRSKCLILERRTNTFVRKGIFLGTCSSYFQTKK